MKAADLYDTDFAEWARVNTELLRSGQFSDADVANIAEEIEDLGKNKRSAVYSRFVRLIEHLLKWQFQPEGRSRSWERTIVVQRLGIAKLLAQNPSLRPCVPEMVGEAYQDAAKVVCVVLMRDRAEFPDDCPYTVQQLVEEDFLP
jgi:hypothetical protein